MLTLRPDEEHREDYRNGGRFVAAVNCFCSELDTISRYPNRCNIDLESRHATFPDVYKDDAGQVRFGVDYDGLHYDQIQKTAQYHGFITEITETV